jgi:esterase/lipase superfamily enzyme
MRSFYVVLVCLALTGCSSLSPTERPEAKRDVGPHLAKSKTIRTHVERPRRVVPIAAARDQDGLSSRIYTRAYRRFAPANGVLRDASKVLAPSGSDTDIVSPRGDILVPAVKALQPVYFATNRKVIDATPLTAASFTAARSMDLRYGLTIVSVPDAHVVGKVERPKFNYFKWRYNNEVDSKDFRIRSITALVRSDLVNELRVGPDSVLLFVHGYNVTFADAVFRAAQIAYDANFEGKVLVFSWPSAGVLLGYDADVASARFSESDLVGVLRMLSEEIGDKRLHVIVHSLGNQILVNALQQAALSSVKLKIAELVLAAPDVDKDEFLKKAKEIKSVAPNMTMYASAADKALMASDKKAWDMKLGYIGADGPNLVDGVETIDVTALGDDMFGLNHGVFAGNRTVLTDLAQLIRSKVHLSPIDRTPTLKFMPNKQEFKYWMFPK